MNNSLRAKLQFYGMTHEWIHSGEIERLSMEWGYSAENGRREMRRLVKLGRFEQRITKGCAEYRYKEVEKETEEERERRILMEITR